MRIVAIVLSLAVASQAAFDSSTVASIQSEFDDFSKINSDRGIKLVLGNTKSGDQQVFQAGNAAKGVPVSDKTIYRMGGMTKVMTGMLTAIAFEEGVVLPDEPISKYISEFRDMKVVESRDSQTIIVPSEREFTFRDCLAMKCGFSYSYWGMGTLRDAATITPGDGLLPDLAADKCAGAMTTARNGKLVRADEWVRCRAKYPLIAQPGTRPFYGYDYDVIGIALARAYKMDAEMLMKEKIWSKLGMESAFMSWLPTGTSPKGEVADLYFKAPPASAYAAGQSPAGMTPGMMYWAKDVSNWDSEMWNLMNTFEYETSSDATYPGVSGYGEGAMMTFEDFAKFLMAVVDGGVGANGEQVICKTMWKRFLSTTIEEDEGMGFVPPFQYFGADGDYSMQSEWRWGFTGRRNVELTKADGSPTHEMLSETSDSVGQWSGIFGTTFKFDVDGGMYAVGGENTFSSRTGSDQVGADFIKKNMNRWIAKLMKGESMPAVSISSTVQEFDDAEAGKIQAEMDKFSADNSDRGVKVVIGNAKTGEQRTFQAGNAAKGKPVSDKTIYRIGGMTKVLTGMLTAIAFEEGVISPDEKISDHVPEFAMAGLNVVTSKDGQTVVSPLERDFTFWDCLGMKCGFSYSQWGMGTHRATTTISPTDTLLQALSSDKCAGSMTTSRDGKLVRAADWVECRKKHPLVAQPGSRPFYGADYDVIGLALSRAYKKNPEALMKEKIFDKLEMGSAFMSWLPQGTSPNGEVADLFFEGPPASAFASGRSPSGMTPGAGHWASDVSNWDDEMWNVMGRFGLEQSGDAEYPGVSGYGEGAMMTFEDFAKFLHAVVRRGNGANGEKVIGETMWKWFMSPTTDADEGLGFVPVAQYDSEMGYFSEQAQWKWGFSSKKKDKAGSDVVGSPQTTMASEMIGEWFGEFGTMFQFDAETGMYAVGGENTVLVQAGVDQKSAEFVGNNVNRWSANLCKGKKKIPDSTLPKVFSTKPMKVIQDEISEWSKNNNDRGVKVIIGNAKTGEQRTFQAGNAAAGVAVDDKTIYRMGGMTKIMAGVVTSMAMDEGIISPQDPISKYVTDLAGMKVAKSVDGTTVKHDQERDFTFWDCLGMKCGFSYSYWGTGTLTEAADIPPSDGVLPDLKSDKCAGALLTSNNGKLTRAADFVNCRKSIPLVSQPGERPFYGYDYDVIGLALSRAYGKDAAQLMKEKLWDKIGMDSAFMSWLPNGQAPNGKVADLFFTAPKKEVFPSKTMPQGMVEGDEYFAKDVFKWDDDMWNVMGEFDYEESADMGYPGVSGYGEGAMMTFEDFAKFLVTVLNDGTAPNGEKVVNPLTMKRILTETINADESLGFVPAGQFMNAESQFNSKTSWAWGFSENEETGLKWWQGVFGTLFGFDPESGYYFVGGENTMPAMSGSWQKGEEYIKKNVDRWRKMLECDQIVEPKTLVPTLVPTTAPTLVPTTAPTLVPTTAPTLVPTTAPTLVPTSTPTTVPTQAPFSNGTTVPTTAPTQAPFSNGTTVPTTAPTQANATMVPTTIPTQVPSANTTAASTTTPTQAPSANTTAAATTIPTQAPSANMTAAPSQVPSANTTTGPTTTPSLTLTSVRDIENSTSDSPSDVFGASRGEEKESFSSILLVIIIVTAVLLLCATAAGVYYLRKRGAVKLSDFNQAEVSHSNLKTEYAVFSDFQNNILKPDGDQVEDHMSVGSAPSNPSVGSAPSNPVSGTGSEGITDSQSLTSHSTGRVNFGDMKPGRIHVTADSTLGESSLGPQPSNRDQVEVALLQCDIREG